MKKIILLLLIFSNMLSWGQNRKPIKGRLLYRNVNVVAASVVNNTAQINTITDADGEFEIEVALGDEVLFSSVQYLIRTIIITPEILQNNRLTVSVNERINALEEVVITPYNTEKFLNLKEEEFKSYDYALDKSSEFDNVLVKKDQLNNGLNLINVVKLIAKMVSDKTEEEKNNLKPSEILLYVFDNDFFTRDLKLKDDQVVGFLEHIDKKLPSQKLLKVDKKFELIDYLISESKSYKAQF